MFVYDLTTDRNASVGLTTNHENGSMRIKLQFNKPLPEAITCLLYEEFDSSFLVDFARNFRPNS